MNFSFSFSGDIYEKLLKEYEDCIPGIEKMVLCYRGKNAELFSLQKEAENSIRSIDLNEYSEFIENEMNGVLTNYWLKKEKVPFEKIEKKQKKQLDIFDESNMPVLVIRIESGIQRMCDILFIYLNENASANFIMSKEAAPYSQQTKTYMGYMLYRRINQDVTVWRRDQQIFRKLSEKYEKISTSVASLSNETKSNFIFFKDICDYLAGSNLSNSQKTVVLEEDVYSYLFDNYRSMSQVNDLLKEAFDFKSGMSSKNEITITKAEVAAGIKDNDVREADDTEELRKAYYYLDKYETIAQRAPKNEIVSVKYIALECDGHSLASVTMSINSRKPYIIKLLDLYPEKWLRIRNELAPVRKLTIDAQKKLNLKTG